MNSASTSQQVDTVLKHIKDLLSSGRLEPGERLPAERRLAAQLNVSRAHVRTAFQKLEFYGIAKTFPQSGTVVAQEKMQVLNSMIIDALKIDRYDFSSLVDVRILLEIEAVKLCARNRTEEDLTNIEAALTECESFFNTEERVNKDFAYHQAVAQGGHNPVATAHHHARRTALLPKVQSLLGSQSGGLLRAPRNVAFHPRTQRRRCGRHAPPTFENTLRVFALLQRRTFSRNRSQEAVAAE